MAEEKHQQKACLETVGKSKFYFGENGSKVNSAKKSQSGKLGDGEVHRAGRCPLRKNLIREIKVQEEQVEFF